MTRRTYQTTARQRAMMEGAAHRRLRRRSWGRHCGHICRAPSTQASATPSDGRPATSPPPAPPRTCRLRWCRCAPLSASRDGLAPRATDVTLTSPGRACMGWACVGAAGYREDAYGVGAAQRASLRAVPAVLCVAHEGVGARLSPASHRHRHGRFAAVRAPSPLPPLKCTACARLRMSGDSLLLTHAAMWS